jgi:hypothetical protein
VAGLFLEVIVRHVPGLVGWTTTCRQTITDGFSRLFSARIGPKRQGLGLNITRGNPFLSHDESANIWRSLMKKEAK